MGECDQPGVQARTFPGDRDISDRGDPVLVPGIHQDLAQIGAAGQCGRVDSVDRRLDRRRDNQVRGITVTVDRRRHVRCRAPDSTGPVRAQVDDNLQLVNGHAQRGIIGAGVLQGNRDAVAPGALLPGRQDECRAEGIRRFNLGQGRLGGCSADAPAKIRFGLCAHHRHGHGMGGDQAGCLLVLIDGVDHVCCRADDLSIRICPIRSKVDDDLLVRDRNAQFLVLGARIIQDDRDVVAFDSGLPGDKVQILLCATGIPEHGLGLGMMRNSGSLQALHRIQAACQWRFDDGGGRGKGRVGNDVGVDHVFCLGDRRARRMAIDRVDYVLGGAGHFSGGIGGQLDDNVFVSDGDLQRFVVARMFQFDRDAVTCRAGIFGDDFEMSSGGGRDDRLGSRWLGVHDDREMAFRSVVPQAADLVDFLLDHGERSLHGIRGQQALLLDLVDAVHQRLNGADGALHSQTVYGGWDSIDLRDGGVLARVLLHGDDPRIPARDRCPADAIHGTQQVVRNCLQLGRRRVESHKCGTAFGRHSFLNHFQLLGCRVCRRLRSGLPGQLRSIDLELAGPIARWCEFPGIHFRARSGDKDIGDAGSGQRAVEVRSPA